eukprot:TRINITY_DN12989_c0_g1_i6.p1 TRINITY_DN12989_c0_g1~~TRINITY_DN12989_c0_g1_i6.p1  ORF type:complete len:382 (+),score=73.34 TRINITY_DN12989_c0_g1_i6:110-1147(+)
MMASLVVRRYGLRPLTTPLPVFYYLRSFSTKPDSSKALASSGSLLSRALAETKKAGAEFSQGTKQFYYNLKNVYGTLVPALKRGEHLSRGDLILVRKTKSDVLRLVPFSLYFCIPLSAVLLPVVMRILPQIIPSTFWTASSKEQMSRRRDASAQVGAQDLRKSMMQRAAKLVHQPSLTSMTSEQMKALENMVNTVGPRLESGQPLAPQDMQSLAPLFDGPFGLRALQHEDRDTLLNLAKIHNVGGLLARPLLPLMVALQPKAVRKILEGKSKVISQDDDMIPSVDTLTEEEQKEACEDRAIPWVGRPSSSINTSVGSWLALAAGPTKKLSPEGLLYLSALSFRGK